VGQQRLDPRGCASDRRRQPESETPNVDRLHPVHVFVRVDRRERRIVINVPGRRMLEEHGVDPRVGVEIGDHREHVGLRRGARQVHVRGREAQLGGLLMFHPDVPGARWIVSHEQGGQAGDVSSCDQHIGAGAHVFEHGTGNGGSGHHEC
jgi:hypothetical protein